MIFPRDVFSSFYASVTSDKAIEFEGFVFS